MKLSTYVQTEWSVYGSKSNRRQLPSMCDGFNKSSRKLVWALKEETKFEIVERLGLKAAERTSYANGGSNMVDTLVGLVKGFPGTNNVPMFDGEGQFGYVADPDSSAPRYISCKISKNFSRWFNSIDFNVMERVQTRDEVLEPVVMAPIAPLILVNGGFGIGNGYACNIPHYLPEDVICATLEVLNHGCVMNPLTPNWVGWEGTISSDPEKCTKYHPKGKFTRIDSKTLEVNCLPPSYDESTYMKKVLIPLYESQAIQQFDNESNDIEGWKIIIHFKRGVLSKLTDTELEDMLGLVNTNKPINLNLTCWGVDGLIKKYEYVEELVEEWVEWRLGVYQQRIDYEFDLYRGKIRYEKAKLFMIDLLQSNRPRKQELIDKLKDFRPLTDKQIDSLLNIPVMNLTVEGVSKSLASIEQFQSRIKFLESITPKKYMQLEVKELLSKTLGN